MSWLGARVFDGSSSYKSITSAVILKVTPVTSRVAQVTSLGAQVNFWVALVKS